MNYLLPIAPSVAKEAPKNIILRVWWLWTLLKQHAHSHLTRHIINAANIADYGAAVRGLRKPIQVALWFLWIALLFYDIRMAFVILLIPPMAIVGLFIVPMILPFVVFFYGAYLSLSISQIIHRQQTLNTYAVLCVTPAGALVFNWRIASALLYRSSFFSVLEWVIKICFVLVGIFIHLILLLFLIFNRLDVATLQDIQMLLQASMVWAGLYVAHIQTIVLAVIVGILVPNLERTRLEAGFISVVMYFVAQIVCYAPIAMLISFGNAMVGGQSLGLDLLLPIVYFVITVVWWCVVIVGLWRVVTYQLNVAENELRYIG